MMHHRTTYIGDYNLSRKRKITIAIFYTIVFFAIFFIMGPRKTDDTESYYIMASYREPLYGLLLRFAKGVFGNYDYTAVAVFQNILAIATSAVLAFYLIEKNKIRHVVAQASVVLIVLAPYVMSIYYTATHVFVPNAMMSEGIAIPMYNLLVYFFLHFIWEEKLYGRVRILLECKIWITMFIILLTRGQLLSTAVVWAIIELIVWIRDQKKRKSEQMSWMRRYSIVLFIAFLGLLLTGKSIIVGFCNQIYNGVWTQTSYTSTTFVTNLIYVSDFEDGEVIEDEEIRQIFEQIFWLCREEQRMIYFAPEAFDERAEYFAKTHDIIKMEIYQNQFLGYMGNTMPDATYEEKMLHLDEISLELIKDRLPQCFGKWFRLYWENVGVGLVRSLMVLRKWSYLPSIAVYVFLIVSAIYLLHKKKQLKIVAGMETRVKEIEQTLWYFLLVTILTAGCVSSVSLLIMCLSRYMVYNICLIYMAVFLMARQIYFVKKTGGK